MLPEERKLQRLQQSHHQKDEESLRTVQPLQSEQVEGHRPAVHAGGRGVLQSVQGSEGDGREEGQIFLPQEGSRHHASPWHRRLAAAMSPLPRNRKQHRVIVTSPFRFRQFEFLCGFQRVISQ